jgi:hypothetical protein
MLIRLGYELTTMLDARNMISKICSLLPLCSVQISKYSTMITTKTIISNFETVFLFLFDILYIDFLPFGYILH